MESKEIEIIVSAFGFKKSTSKNLKRISFVNGNLSFELPSMHMINTKMVVDSIKMVYINHGYDSGKKAVQIPILKALDIK